MGTLRKSYDLSPSYYIRGKTGFYALDEIPEGLEGKSLIREVINRQGEHIQVISEFGLIQKLERHGFYPNSVRSTVKNIDLYDIISLEELRRSP